MGLVTVLLLVACHQKKPLDEVEITQIAKEAYIYGFPVVELYRDMYIHAIDKDNSRFLASFRILQCFQTMFSYFYLLSFSNFE